MKKTFITTLLCLIICLILATPAFAVEGKISATSAKKSEANCFTVELRVDNNPGFIAIQPRIEYDSKVLKLVAANNGELFDRIYMKGKDGTSPYDLIFMNPTAPENITKSGVLAKYTFEVLSNVNETEIKFSIKDTSVFGLDKNKPTFNACTVKVDLKDVSNLPVQQNPSSSTKDEQNTLSSAPQNSDSTQGQTQQNQGDEVQSNQGDEVQPNQGDEVQPNQGDEVQPNQGDENNSDQGLNQNTVLLIISFLVVVIIGALVTGFAIYKKKQK